MAGGRLDADLWISEYISPCDIYQHGVLRILAQGRTAFQDYAVVESGPYGRALILDGKWQTCTGDEFLYHEPLVHVPCTLHGGPERVLIAGGADGGALREVLKWKTVQEAVVADIDGEVVQACIELLPEVHQQAFADPRARLEIGDAWQLIERTAGYFDVIIADLTDPIEEGPAFPLFTQEFFLLCQRALRPGGFFINQAGSVSPPFVQMLGRVSRTIGRVFRETSVVTAHVPTYGSPWGLVLASDSEWSRTPAPDEVDGLLAEQLTGPLRSFDGGQLLALLQTPKYVHAELAREDVIYTLANPPRFFGQGVAGSIRSES